MSTATAPTMRARFVVHSVKTYENSTQEDLSLGAVTGGPGSSFGPNGESDDNTFARWTPSATCTMSITNPNLHGQFKQGDKFYVDFTRAE